MWRNGNREVGAEAAEKFEYALKECRWCAENFEGPARPAAVDGVYSRDDIPPALLERLLDGIDKVRKEEIFDVHPGSDGLVIDVVHPSMYAYEQGVTPVAGGADVFKMPPWNVFVATRNAVPDEKPGKVDGVMSSKAGLTWLPAEFYIREGGAKCDINSYINSLHPVKHNQLYDAIGDAFLVCAPVLSEVFSELGTVEERYERPLRVGGGLRRAWSDRSFNSDSDNDERYWTDRYIILPTIPEEFVPPARLEPLNLVGKHLQVIVKIASIELTPEKPSYSGGNWHVEGMRNERIVATACMYLQNDNCTESMLEFRTTVQDPEYEQVSSHRFN